MEKARRLLKIHRGRIQICDLRKRLKPCLGDDADVLKDSWRVASKDEIDEASGYNTQQQEAEDMRS